jgi:uncharacterized protein
MEQRMSFITLGVSDLKLMKDFYMSKFGWEPAIENENIVFFKLNGFFLGLYGREALADDAQVDGEGTGFRRFTLAYNLRSEKEVDDLFTELASKGVKVVKPAQKVFWGGYSGYIADAEDNLWEIAYNPFIEMDKAGNILGHKPL